MTVQASIGLIETYFVAKLGLDALAGMALVFPLFMLLTMISAGAMGGGILTAVARALGSGNRERANELVWSAVAITIVLGALTSVLALTFGPKLYALMGGRNGSLAAAVTYSTLVFAGAIPTWLFNSLAAVIRGTGNMFFPAAVVSVGALVLIPLSPLLIFGIGPFPHLGIVGGATAVLSYYIVGTGVFAFYIWSGRGVLKPPKLPTRLYWAPLRDILRVGAFSSVVSVTTNVAIIVATGLAGLVGPAAVAGYGTGARLEYLLVPLVFGLGAPVAAMVGTSIGAGNRARALARGMDRLGHRICHHRSDWIARRMLPGGVAVAVRQRSDDDQNRDALSPHRRPGLWLLRWRFGFVFRRRKAPAAWAGRFGRRLRASSSPPAAAGSRSPCLAAANSPCSRCCRARWCSTGSPMSRRSRPVYGSSSRPECSKSRPFPPRGHREATMTSDRTRIPLYLDDLTPGRIFRGQTSIAVDETAIKTFAKLYDPQPFHLDDIAAKATLFGGLAASGWHTAAMTMQLLVTDGPPLAGGIIGAGTDELRWPKPVRPGDSLRIESEVVDVRPSRSRPEQGLVKMRTTTFNQNGEPVQILVANLIVPRKPGAG